MALISRHSKPASHHKKARGAHHRHSKHYLKTYSPYLPLLILVVVGLAINTFWTSRSQVLGAQTNLTAAQLLQDTNRERGSGNQNALSLNSMLSSAAQSKAFDMVSKDYWDHTSPDGTEPWEFIKDSGYEYSTAGENLAQGFNNSQAIIAGWMNSREHRANLLNPDYREVGFGIVNAPDFRGEGPTTIIVAMYGQPAIPGFGEIASASMEAPSEIPYRTVSRVQLMTNGQAPWSYMLITVASFIAAALFVLRHLKAWRRVLIKSEEFIVHHKMLDYLFVVTAVTGFVLTRAAGSIH